MTTQELQSIKNKFDIIGNDPALNRALDIAVAVAPTDLTVLIFGESGVGKENIPKIIHQYSRRRTGKYFAINCGAIPEGTIDSELFGHEKGAFTGAVSLKKGRFELADGGTLFLDEINSMEKSVQAKILKAIEEKQVVRLGGYEPIKTDVKIVSAINQDPIKCVEEGRIRSDLFYRLSVVQINVPPLRERQKDLFYLTDHFIKEFNKLMGREILGLVEEAESIFRAYSWPGNVRELKNVIEGAFNIASGRFIKASDLPAYIKQNVSGSHSRNLLAGDTETEMFIPGNLEEAMRNYEREIISRALQMTDSYVEAAELLGITKQNLNYKMNKLGIKR